MAETIDNDASCRRRRRRFLLIVARGVLATIVGVALLMNIFERKQEARNPFYRVVELTDETEDPGGLGQELSAAVRRLPTHRGSGAHALRRQRSRAAHADRGRPALGRRAIEARRRPALEDDVGRLRLREGFPRGARPRLHARRPDLHRAPAGGQAARHLPALPRLGLRALQESWANGDLIKASRR